MKDLLIIISLLSFLVSGCGYYDDLKLEKMIGDYKLTCFGDRTNSCQNKLVETNIAILEQYKKNIDRNKSQFIEDYGDKGYFVINKYLDDLIEEQNNLRPGWFSRVFFSGSQEFSPSGNDLINAGDLADIGLIMESKFKIKKSLQSNVTPAPAPVQVPSTNDTIKNVVGIEHTSITPKETEYNSAYKCALESFENNYGAGPAAFCAGNSHDPTDIENKAYKDAERDYLDKIKK